MKGLKKFLIKRMVTKKLNKMKASTKLKGRSLSRDVAKKIALIKLPAR